MSELLPVANPFALRLGNPVPVEKFAAFEGGQ